MEKKILSLFVVTVFLVIACKEAATEPPIETINDHYYVIKDGASFVYNLSITDTNGITVNGNRYMLLNDSTIIGGTGYKIQIDSFDTVLQFDTLSTTSISYIRKSNTGVFTFADTTGFTGFLPDSLRQYLTVDRESRLFFYPLTVGQKFPVFTLSLSYLFYGISVIDVDATVESSEVLNINVNNNPTQLNALKIKYDFVLRPSSTDSSYYSAYGWAVKDLGFVKWDGDSEVFNFLFNENIFPPETNVKVDLTQYNIP